MLFFHVKEPYNSDLADFRDGWNDPIRLDGHNVAFFSSLYKEKYAVCVADSFVIPKENINPDLIDKVKYYDDLRSPYAYWFDADEKKNGMFRGNDYDNYTPNDKLPESYYVNNLLTNKDGDSIEALLEEGDKIEFTISKFIDTQSEYATFKIL